MEKGDTKYTLSGSAISVDDTGIVPTNVILSGRSLAFDPSIDTNNLHVIGVTENDTIIIGNKTYYWTDADNNIENGYYAYVLTKCAPSFAHFGYKKIHDDMMKKAKGN